MSGKTQPKFPVVVDDPASIRMGKLFLRDLAATGPIEADVKAIARGVTTVGQDHRNVELTKVVVADRYTSLLDYSDGRRYQVELLLGEPIVPEMTVQKLEDYIRDDHWRLLLVTRNKLSADAESYCDSNPDIAVTRLDIESWTGTGVL
jgi:hypothetical protein